ncbi:phospholipid transport system transporter-binding protein [Nitrosospira sp. Nsp11]|uniref:STAS domain-containing protein n=1 Tax=Nitrosospira sp. Nsp11 TaxID=1855338 RepID=UPI00091AD044|nr:STAS domain-containing protein [Nitrosospira sp. Nsp11]SHL93906.1 phospholipid transport system transporter-binding protein [Nitrosospira sp. Nsp11]
MIEDAARLVLRAGGELSVEGSITINNVVAMVGQGIALFDRDNMVIDLARVTEVDSSAVSMLLEWQREAGRRNCPVRFANIPLNLRSLVQLYGLSELMHVA